ncbi:LytR C-terminal domain-containing protein [Blastococcus sp. TF02A-26]|uniref:LytR C-terminal domain-containing protein n=1 Tax=Blastococcus sp. TF02A-26 TaxID=2250577 RepID=UPI000DE9ED36|nr:LytR C-terminal domain-containing protein [Blastococcus sp. TF02A-26]RBY90582.1 LytR family transcriptional regulator [Blastococcus sp. TF02A-26]
MSTTTDRPTLRPRGPRRTDRRPLAPLVFLLVLALAALGVWWKVFGDAAAEEDREEAACAAASSAPPQLDPATVRLRVFNATDTPGLAQQVGDELRARGFAVEEVANDPTDREVTGVGELRHGPRGSDAAAFARVFLPGAEDWRDTRADDRVDFVLGPEFTALPSPEEVAAVLEPASSAAAECDSPVA